ncbi:MAG: hypothetical protein ABI723_06320 [Bacteroidia bacterium]
MLKLDRFGQRMLAELEQLVIKHHFRFKDDLFLTSHSSDSYHISGDLRKVFYDKGIKKREDFSLFTLRDFYSSRSFGKNPLVELLELITTYNLKLKEPEN